MVPGPEDEEALFLEKHDANPTIVDRKKDTDFETTEDDAEQSLKKPTSERSTASSQTSKSKKKKKKTKKSTSKKNVLDESETELIGTTDDVDQEGQRPNSSKSVSSTTKSKKTKKKLSSKKNVTQEEEHQQEEEEALSSTKSSSSKSKKKKKKIKTTSMDQDPHVTGAGKDVAEDPPALRVSEVMRLETAPTSTETTNINKEQGLKKSKSKKKRIEHDGNIMSTSKQKIVVDEDEDGAVELSQKRSDPEWEEEVTNGGNGTPNGETNGHEEMNGAAAMSSTARSKAMMEIEPNKSLDKIYGSRCGAIATLSMALNAGLMIYAHLGLSAVVLSNQPPIPEVNPNPTPPPTTPSAPDNSTDFTGACNEADYAIWLNGGEANRTEQSSFCSRLYNEGGCLLDEECINECFQTEFGYSAECSTCFAGVPNCGVEQGCALVCLADSFSEECQECNIPCTQQLDSCLGFPDDSAAPPTPPSGSSQCSDADLAIWNSGGDTERVAQSDFCSRTYNGGCLLDEPCIEECFQTTYGYSPECSVCFSAIIGCGFENGCAIPCIADSFSEECTTCNIPCTEDLERCLGVSSGRRDLHELQNDVSLYWESASRASRDRMLQDAPELDCPSVNLDEIDQWYEVYRLTFVDSIQKAWQGDAIFLALLIVVFSGIWPYMKNLLLIFAWYAPISVERRTSILTWLLRLSKYTLVDVFAVIVVLVGVQLELDIAGATVVTRAEPRPAIIAFFVATLWEFVQIEWTVYMHNKHVHYDLEDDDSKTREVEDTEDANRISKTTNGTNSSSEDSKNDENFLMAMRFRTKLRSNKKADSILPSSVPGIYGWIIFLLVTTLAMYISGATTELLNFTTSSIASPTECVKSYNLISLGNALINTLSLKDSAAPAGTWTLYIAYVILVVFLPIVVHIMQMIVLSISALTLKSGEGGTMKKLEKVCHVMSSLFGFSSIEVLLIGIYAVEHKFEAFVAELAGPGNAAFFTITSDVGAGFYILIVYSFSSGFLQYFIHCCETEYYRIDPYHKVHVMWTYLFGCWLKKSGTEETC